MRDPVRTRCFREEFAAGVPAPLLATAEQHAWFMGYASTSCKYVLLSVTQLRQDSKLLHLSASFPATACQRHLV